MKIFKRVNLVIIFLKKYQLKFLNKNMRLFTSIQNIYLILITFVNDVINSYKVISILMIKFNNKHKIDFFNNKPHFCPFICKNYMKRKHYNIKLTLVFLIFKKAQIK